MIMIMVGVMSGSARAADEDENYKALTAAAVEEHSLGHYVEARTLFAKAHAVDPNARTLWGMGTAAFEGRQYVDAIQLLQAALRNLRKPLTPSQKTHAESLIARSQDFVVHVQFDVQPRSASVAVDGRDISPDAKGGVLLDSGAHQIVVVAKGYQDHIRSVQWAPGTARLRVRLEPTATETPAQPVASSARPEAHSDSPATGSPLRVLKWVAMGGALAAAGVAGAGLALRQAEATRWNDSTKCPQPKHQSCSDTPGLVHRWETMAIAGGASVGVLAVTAVVLFVLDRPAKRDAQQARLACLPSGPFAQIDCRLSF